MVSHIIHPIFLHVSPVCHNHFETCFCFPINWQSFQVSCHLRVIATCPVIVLLEKVLSRATLRTNPLQKPCSEFAYIWKNYTDRFFSLPVLVFSPPQTCRKDTVLDTAFSGKCIVMALLESDFEL